MMGDPSKLSVIHKTAALARARPTLLLSWPENRAWLKGRERIFQKIKTETKLTKLSSKVLNLWSLC